jgi:hypothetical protein
MEFVTGISGELTASNLRLAREHFTRQEPLLSIIGLVQKLVKIELSTEQIMQDESFMLWQQIYKKPT